MLTKTTFTHHDTQAFMTQLHQVHMVSSMLFIYAPPCAVNGMLFLYQVHMGSMLFIYAPPCAMNRLKGMVFKD